MTQIGSGRPVARILPLFFGGSRDKEIYVRIRYLTSVILLLCAAGWLHAESILWKADLGGATSQAKQEGKAMMVDVYTDWCAWCKRLDDDVYTDGKVIAESKNFIPLKLNPEKSTEGADFAKKYGVNGYPTILFVDGEGTLISKVVGYRDATSFLVSMEKTVEYGAKVKADLKEFDSGVYGHSRELLTMLVDLGRTEDTIRVFEKLRTVAPLEPSLQEKAALSIGRSLVDYGQYDRAIKYLEIAEVINSDSDSFWQAFYLHSIALFYEKGKTSAIGLLDKRLGDFTMPEIWRSRYQELRKEIAASKDASGN